MADDTLQAEVQAALAETYVIERELPRGGMSRVFVAMENALRRRVVIKVLSPELAATLSAERFKREIAMAARLQHPHIVPLLSAGLAGEHLYYTMPLVDGDSLRERMNRERPMAFTDISGILMDVAPGPGLRARRRGGAPGHQARKRNVFPRAGGGARFWYRQGGGDCFYFGNGVSAYHAGGHESGHAHVRGARTGVWRRGT